MKLQIKDLKESNDFLNGILDNIDSAVFIVDKEFIIQDFNDARHILFHSKPEDEILGELCGNAIGCINVFIFERDCGLTPECAQCGLRNSVFKSFVEKVPVYQNVLKREIRIRGVVVLKYYKFSTKYVTFETEEMVMVVVDDISESERQKEHLKQLNEEKNKFLGIASHDMRNPAGAIKMYSEYMLKAGSLDLKLEEEDYCKFVTGIIEINRAIAMQKGMSIELQPAECKVSIDNARMTQVFNNLISNAIKFSEKGTTISIKITRRDNDILTEIIDQGQGIPVAEQTKLFNPYSKTSVKSTDGEKSTGLGLAIVRKIISAHNGSIDIISEPGKGSNFYFVLPIV